MSFSINSTESKITQIRYTCLKEFDIDVVNSKGMNNLSIIVKSEEDKQGEDTELTEIRVENMTFSVGDGEDVGDKLNGHLGRWFDDKYPELPVEKTQEDFDNIFSLVWDYIEEKDLW